jgi:DNA-binding winged helix-turn-helix (wHTH) protein/Tol biopolymer transport system component
MKHFAFDGFTLDPANHLLLRGGAQVALPPKAFDTLAYLAENHGRLVTREELMKAVWPDSFVEGANLTVYISLLRKALGEEEGRRYIETVPRKGYRLIADVRVVDEVPTEAVAEVVPSPRIVRRHPFVWWAAAVGAVLAVAVLVLAAGRLRSVPPLRRVRLTSFGQEMAVTAAALSPDGKLAAYANASGIFVQQIDTGEAYPLTAPTTNFKTLSMSWYPDGTKLLVGGFAEHADTPDLWTVQVMGEGRPARLGDGLQAAVSPEGNAIAISGNMRWSPPESSRMAAPEIRLMGADGSGLRTLVKGANGETFGPVAWTRGKQAVTWVRYRWNPQLRRNSGLIDAYDLDTGKTTVLMVGSDFTGDIESLGGKRTIYATSVGANPSSKYGGRLFELDSGSRAGEVAEWSEPIGGLSGNAAGSRLIVRNLMEEHTVFVAELPPGAGELDHCRRLTLGLGREDLPRAWTPDSQTVVFDSNRNGTWELFKQNLNAATDEPVVRSTDDVFTPRLSPDGTSYLFIERPKDWTEPASVAIMRAPVSGGAPQMILKLSGISDWGLRFECSAVAGKPCVLAQRQGKEIVFRAFDPVHGLSARNEVARIDADPAHPPAWTMAPDGLSLAWTRWEATGARIHVLPVAGKAVPDREVDVQNCSHVHSMHWSADGKGWLITSEWPVSWSISYAGLDGRARVLLQGMGMHAPDAFPSPDGRHLAFSQRIMESNLWLIEGF